MRGSDTRQSYIDRAEQELKNSEAATLSHVRDRCRRSAAAWYELAERAARSEKTRAAVAAKEAARQAEELP